MSKQFLGMDLFSAVKLFVPVLNIAVTKGLDLLLAADDRGYKFNRDRWATRTEEVRRLHDKIVVDRRG